MPSKASEAAATLGRIRTPKKAESARRNLAKARASIPAEIRTEKGKKAIKKVQEYNAKLTPQERSERARKAVLARWAKVKKSAG